MMTSLSGTGHRMLREVMFASAVWSCVLSRVSEAVEAFALIHAVTVGRSRARRKAILYSHTFLSLFGLSAGKTRRSYMYMRNALCRNDCIIEYLYLYRAALHRLPG